jgi:hypothetical protein
MVPRSKVAGSRNAATPPVEWVELAAWGVPAVQRAWAEPQVWPAWVERVLAAWLAEPVWLAEPAWLAWLEAVPAALRQEAARVWPVAEPPGVRG